MNNPCKNKSYRAVLKILLEIEDLQFSSKHELEFEYEGWKNPTEEELELKAIELFQDKYSECFDMESSVEVISINKF